ncbi:SMC family ATPase [Microbacterium lacus]|uniref:AAA family ATPase n=1 Tax=Microbacterium lacus TaxID=415217 RepID=UPI00384E75C2
MKLHRLELAGFGPFRDRQSVDFDAFDSDGLFLITGRTGAGKSSILDGVCYSLYGTAPRYDGGDRGLRSDHAAADQPTEVQLEFSAAGKRWRVTRTPEYDRPKARGEGTTTQKSSVLIEEQVEGGWIGRATKYREAADLLDEIVGLNRDQFQQVILLAQNRFAEFLLARNDDRQALLRTLFGSRRYEEYERAFDERRRVALGAVEADSAMLQAQLSQAESLVAEHELHGMTDDADVPPTTVAERLEALDRAVPRARYRAAESARVRDELQGAHDDALTVFGALTTQRARQEERLTSRAALAKLTDREDSIALDRARLDRARLAEALRTAIDAAARATHTRDGSVATLSGARDAWVASGEQDASAADLRALIDVLSGDIAVWSQSADVERSLPSLTAALARADARVAERESASAQLATEAAARAERIGLLEPAIVAAIEKAPDLESSRVQRAAAESRAEAGREAERLGALAHAADAAHLAAAQDLDAATTAVRVLLQRRLDGYAGELATTLVDGEACQVCGSIDHPHPAPPAAEPVTEDVVATAEAAVQRAHDRASAASDAAHRARAAHHGASARAGGDTLETLVAASAAAEAHLARAIAAADELASLRSELREMRALDESSASVRERAVEDLTAAKEERAARSQALAAAQAAVDSARSSFVTVTERIAEAESRRARARALADAIENTARLSSTAAEAVAHRDERLAGSVFDSVEDAVASLIDPAAHNALAGEIQGFDVALASERQRLLALETELAGVPDEPVDLAEASATAVIARDAWHGAVRTAERDAQVSARVADALARAATAHAASAERTAEFELIAGLAGAVSGRNETRMDLETFVLAAELEEIVEAANLRLDAMSSGRYRLQHSDAVGRRRTASGLGITVLDAYTGQPRPPQSLSGGETFLASLALALGLAEVVTARTGGVRLDTLFIDEGFGSLDEDTLTLAMHTLDELRQGGRTVGLISHVAAMKEQLPAQLIVDATPQGPSVIRQSSVAAAARVIVTEQSRV